MRLPLLFVMIIISITDFITNESLTKKIGTISMIIGIIIAYMISKKLPKVFIAFQLFL